MFALHAATNPQLTASVDSEHSSAFLAFQSARSLAQHTSRPSSASVYGEAFKVLRRSLLSTQGIHKQLVCRLFLRYLRYLR